MAPKRIAVIGSGYVGTVVAACLAWIGHEVIGVESDHAKLALLSSGIVPFHEPGLGALLEEALAGGALRFTDDFGDAMEHSDVVFVCVGTPTGPDGHPDMEAMVSVTRSLAANLTHPHVFVTKSTVPIGTGNWLGSMMEDLVGSGPRLELFSVVSNPEFLAKGVRWATSFIQTAWCWVATTNEHWMWSPRSTPPSSSGACPDWAPTMLPFRSSRPDWPLPR